MIAKITRGQRVGGLVHYLFGPGRANEHTNAHVVAGWDEPERLEPAFTATGKRDLRPMVAHLNAPMAGRESRTGCVWHCSLSSAPGDPVLSDAQWRDIAEEVMDRTGLGPRGDDGACRWVAVRHAENHVHVVATLARQDGKYASVDRDRWKVVAACREVEQRYGLTVVANPDRTAHGETKRAEVEKAARTSGNGLAGEPVRHRLRREVQTAAVGASGPQDFFDRLRHAGVMVKERFSEQDPAQVTGYAVASGNERVAVMALITALQGLVEATAELREAQARTAQAVAARQAAADLQSAVDGVRAGTAAESAQTLMKAIQDPTRGITEDKDHRRGR